MLSEDAIARIGDYAAHQKGLVAVYVFGSVATGRNRQRSDVDLAIMVQGALSPAERVAMETELSNLVHRDVDLVVFHQASSLLQHQVLKHGCLIYEADRAERVRQEVLARRDYLDGAFLYRKLKRRPFHGG